MTLNWPRPSRMLFVSRMHPTRAPFIHQPDSNRTASTPPDTTTMLPPDTASDHLPLSNITELSTDPMLPTEEEVFSPQTNRLNALVYGSTYKPVARQVKPVGGLVPQHQLVVRQFPENPLDSISPLPPQPPDFTPRGRLTKERLASMNINHENFL